VDSLSAHIAILDADGLITSVNRAWRRFADANQCTSKNYGVGMNYFEVCEAARGDDAADATRIAAGLRDVVTGERSGFDTEYPCHSPDERRWFCAHVTRFDEDGLIRLVVAHENITEIKILEQALRLSRDALELRVKERTAELEQVNQALRQFPSKLITAQEDERRRIGAALHDSIGQTLAALKYWVEYVLIAKKEGNSR
jgi:signal transduction histidine kinase